MCVLQTALLFFEKKPIGRTQAKKHSQKISPLEKFDNQRFIKNLKSYKSNFTNGHFCDSKEINFLFLPNDSNYHLKEKC